MLVISKGALLAGTQETRAATLWCRAHPHHRQLLELGNAAHCALMPHLDWMLLNSGSLLTTQSTSAGPLLPAGRVSRVQMMTALGRGSKLATPWINPTVGPV